MKNKEKWKESIPYVSSLLRDCFISGLRESYLGN